MKYAIKITYPDGTIGYMSVNGKSEWSKRSYAQRHIETAVALHGLKMEIEAV